MDQENSSPFPHQRGPSWSLVFPPLPNSVIMIDRVDGTPWLLSHDAGHVKLISNAPIHRFGRESRFGPYSGPHLDFQEVHLRLFVRGGHLGYEVINDAIYNGLVITRNLLDRAFKEIFIPSSWPGHFRLSWRDGV